MRRTTSRALSGLAVSYTHLDVYKRQGEGEGANYKEITYEGYAPGGVAVIVEVVTDNLNRTASEVRHIFDKNGGSMGATGCVAWMFERKGVIELDNSKGLDEDLSLIHICSALFAGVTSILAKCGIRETDSTVATAIRTVVVLAFSWLMVFMVGSQDQLRALDARTLVFLILSGLATGASWLCYFKALQLGDVNKVCLLYTSRCV